MEKNYLQFIVEAAVKTLITGEEGIAPKKRGTFEFGLEDVVTFNDMRGYVSSVSKKGKKPVEVTFFTNGKTMRFTKNGEVDSRIGRYLKLIRRPGFTNMDFISKKTLKLTKVREEFYKILRYRICRITFIKLNGEKRYMRCTLNYDIMPPEAIPIGAPYYDNPKVLRIFDLGIQKWRSFYVSKVIAAKLE